MDCTLRIIAGPEAGQGYVCGAGETYVGRSQRCAVRLNSPSVSFEHALITRVGDDYFIENLSANGTLVNNERVGGKTRLRQRDQIRLGAETVIRVESLPQSAAAGSSRRILLAGLVSIFLLGVAVYVSDVFTSGSAGDWDAAYRVLLPYAQEQVATNRMPQDVPGLMEDAWRLQKAGDRVEARKTWARVHVHLDEWERILGQEPLRTTTKGLQALRSGKAQTLAPEEMQVALKVFVINMERQR
jgi:pSer/pThr/pTyr-binding forkhead associated (FHA) protein